MVRRRPSPRSGSRSRSHSVRSPTRSRSRSRSRSRPPASRRGSRSRSRSRSRSGSRRTSPASRGRPSRSRSWSRSRQRWRSSSWSRLRQRVRQRRRRCGSTGRRAQIEALQADLRQARRAEAEAKRALQDVETVSLSSLHQRLAEVVANRAGGDKPVPEGFEDLVAVLREAVPSQCRVAPMSSDALGRVDVSRNLLRDRQAEVRRATPDQRDAVVAKRDEARAWHVEALREAQETVLRSVDSGGTIESLEARIVLAEAALRRAEAALSVARAAAMAEPRLGVRAPLPRNEEGEADTAAAPAVQAYDSYVRACSSAYMVATTDEAVRTVREELRGTGLFLPGAGLREGIGVRVLRRHGILQSPAKVLPLPPPPMAEASPASPPRLSLPPPLAASVSPASPASASLAIPADENSVHARPTEATTKDSAYPAPHSPLFATDEAKPTSPGGSDAEDAPRTSPATERASKIACVDACRDIAAASASSEARSSTSTFTLALPGSATSDARVAAELSSIDLDESTLKDASHGSSENAPATHIEHTKEIIDIDVEAHHDAASDAHQDGDGATQTLMLALALPDARAVDAVGFSNPESGGSMPKETNLGTSGNAFQTKDELPVGKAQEDTGEVISVAVGTAMVRFSDGSTETVRRTEISEVIDEDGRAALRRLDVCMRKARVAIDAESHFWHGLDQVAALPCAHLLAAGRAEAASRKSFVEALRATRERHATFLSELRDEQDALDPATSRDPAVVALAAAADAHLDAGDALQDAQQAVQRARVRGRPVEPLEEKALQAKQAAKQADAEVRRAMVDLAEAMRRFPEVGSDPTVLKHLRITLPQDLMPLWRVGRTLSHFDSRELLVGASRHRLYCAMEGDQKYAVKEYAIAGGHEGLRVCLHEAALLKRARHPHIVELVAIFADPDEHGFFIQMPFYMQGSLDQWVHKNRPDDPSIRRVLAQVVTALAHLHGLGITHADMKPGNILIDARGVARLGDFDISVDSNVRTSAARAHATMTQVGFTPGFAAPELLRTGASPSSDIYALGATIAEVAPRSFERDLLLQRLQNTDPSARPTAQQVLSDPFFAPVFAWAREERRTCCICLESSVLLEEGLECGRTDGEPHFVCRSCLEQHVEVTCSEELRLRQAHEGRVRCPGRPCNAVAYPDVDLAKSLSAALFRRYTESRLDLLEQRKAAELETQMQARLDAELRRLQALDEQQRRIRAVRNHIVEEILTLKCPRCGQAFLDFVGCFALQCSRCPCGFCAWCGADSGGSNAHEHVRTCREKPLGADVFFGSFEQFEAAQRRRRRRLLQRFLPTLDVQTRQAVLNEMRRDLLDLGLGDLAGHGGGAGQHAGGHPVAGQHAPHLPPPPPKAAAAPPPPFRPPGIVAR